MLLNETIKWNWWEFCGTEKLHFWNSRYEDVDSCFQLLCLRIPALSLIAIVSAFYNGLQTTFIRRNRKELWTLRTRYMTTLTLAALPVVQTYIEVSLFPGMLLPVNYLTAAVECFSWLVHFSFVISLCQRLGKGLRGPILLGVLWTIHFILCCVYLHTNYVLLKSPSSSLVASNVPFWFSIAHVGLQSIYLLTLLPSERANLPQRRIFLSVQSGDQSPLFGVYSRFREDLEPDYLGVALERWSYLSKLFFYWVNPLMEKGFVQKLQNQDDLFDLPDSLTSGILNQKLKKALISKHIYATPSTRVSLLKALHICFWKQFYGIGILKLISDVSGFFGPLLLHGLVTFIENGNEPIQLGYFYALGLFFISGISAFCIPHFNFLMGIVGLKIRGALLTTIYRKTLSLNSITLSYFSMGEIVNFMSTDMDRIVNSCASFHAFWSIPFQIIVTLYLLYQQVGISFIAGLIFTLILIPINKCIAGRIGKLSTKMMTYKDHRILIMSELLRGIRAIKFHVWEGFFTAKISEVRQEEVKYLGGRKYLDAVCVYFWATTPVIISILTFSMYILLGNQLTAPVVFTTIALLNMLIAPLNAFPWVLNGLTEAWVSLKRVQRLLELPDLELDEYYNPLPDYEKPGSVVIDDGIFHWGESNFILNNISLTVPQGNLVAVCGPVGSGKSSLLSAILAELEKCSGSVACAEYGQGFGYAAQTPWLQRGTIQDNILFGEPFERDRYREVLDACALTDDLNILPNRDQTGVGEGGCTLSGGQKARIALARAVYQNHSIYLLDDILSAVDPHVAKHIFTHCICGILKNKTRILCTHNSKFLIHCDWVVSMENGSITDQGPPSTVLPDFIDIVASSELGETDTSTEVTEIELKSESGGSLLTEEDKSTGSLELSVYATYFASIGICLTPLIFASVSLMQASRNVTDWWLAFWVSHQNSSLNFTIFDEDLPAQEDNTKFYLIVYLSIAGANSLLTLARAFLFAYGGLSAAKKIHTKLLSSVIRAKMTFFDSSPLGRILNRFSSDLYTVDDTLPFIMNILVAQFFSLIGTLAMTFYGLPWLCIVLAPLVPVYHWLQNRYRLTSRELKRISSITLSPLYSHFNETIQGLVTIRAFKSSPRFKRDNAHYLESNQKAQLSSNAAAQWLALRLQLIGVATITSVGLLAVIEHHVYIADPGLIGLAISYALSLTGSLGGVVNAFTETEKEMISVERVSQYFDDCDNGPELEVSKPTVIPPFAWPSQGVVTFSNVYMRYRDHLPYALRDVTFSTRPGEKVGVVGRTGAGKSSLIACLFRLVEPLEGTITIDTVNIKLISLQDLRSHLGVIPQDPFVFEGSIRSNLDPLGKHTEGEIWSALTKAHLGGAVKNIGGLSVLLKRDLLSSGQRQLLCLARAILHNAKVILIDEATSNVDEDTDRLIQQTLRSCFKQSTVITIAHRVRTILDSERVLVMGEGRVLEFDTPNALLQDQASAFYELTNEI